MLYVVLTMPTLNKAYLFIYYYLVSLSFSNEICQKNHMYSISIRPMDIKVVLNFVQSESSY
jgi:hypothetical protein